MRMLIHVQIRSQALLQLLKATKQIFQAIVSL
jgi:hypothetical protein